MSPPCLSFGMSELVQEDLNIVACAILYNFSSECLGGLDRGTSIECACSIRLCPDSSQFCLFLFVYCDELILAYPCVNVMFVTVMGHNKDEAFNFYF